MMITTGKLPGGGEFQWEREPIDSDKVLAELLAVAADWRSGDISNLSAAGRQASLFDDLHAALSAGTATLPKAWTTSRLVP